MQGIETAPALPGIYAITAPDGRAYVGRSDDMRRRAREHASGLRLGSHPNVKLREFARKYGAHRLSFSVLELADTTEESTLIAMEESALRRLDPFGARGFNMCTDAKIGGRGILADPEARARHKAAVKASRRNPEFIARMSASATRANADPNRRKLLSEKNKAAWTPEMKAAGSARAKERWSDPNRRAALGEKIRAALAAKKSAAQHTQNIPQQPADFGTTYAPMSECKVIPPPRNHQEESAMSNPKKPPGAAVKVSAYVHPTAYEALARVAIGEGRSMSAAITGIIVSFLRRRGLSVEDGEARGKRSDFDPARTLAQALTRKRAALAREDNRTAAKIKELSK